VCHDIYHCLMLQKDAKDRVVVADELASTKADLKKQQKELNVKRDVLAAGASSPEPTHWLALMWAVLML